MKRLFASMVAFCIFLFPIVALAADTGTQRITKEELKAKMDKGEDIVILDMRYKGSYDGSNIKIKGAVRLSPTEAESKISKGKEVITYCT